MSAPHTVTCMMRVLSGPAHLLYAVFFPVLMPFRIGWNWMRVRGERRGVVWSRDRLHSAVHESALVVWPPLAAFGAWGLYVASGWGPGGAGGDVRGAVLGWLAAGLVVLAVYGARHGEVPESDLVPIMPAHPLRHLAMYAAVFSLYLIVALTLVLLPVALILSI